MNNNYSDFPLNFKAFDLDLNEASDNFPLQETEEVEEIEVYGHFYSKSAPETNLSPIRRRRCIHIPPAPTAKIKKINGNLYPQSQAIDGFQSIFTTSLQLRPQEEIALPARLQTKGQLRPQAKVSHNSSCKVQSVENTLLPSAEAASSLSLSQDLPFLLSFKKQIKSFIQQLLEEEAIAVVRQLQMVKERNRLIVYLNGDREFFIPTELGLLKIQQARVTNRQSKEDFKSELLPHLYQPLKKVKSRLLPIYHKGLAKRDMAETLRYLSGGWSDPNLSAMIQKLNARWQANDAS